MNEIFYKKIPNNKVVAILYIFSLVNIYFFFGLPKNTIFVITNLFILSLSFFSFYLNPYKFSLIKLVYIFIFIFFGLIPLNDINNDNIYWGANKGVNISAMILSNIIIVVGLLFFIIGSKVNLNIIKNVINIFPKRVSSNNIVYCFLYALLTLIILHYNNYSLSLLSFRGVDQDYFYLNGLNLSQVEYLIINFIIRPMPILLLAVYIYANNQNDKNFFLKSYNTSFSVKNILNIIFLVLSIFLVSPISVPRFQAASLYIGVLLILTNFWDKPFRMEASMIFSLFIILPFLDKFRIFNPENFKLNFTFDFLNAGHFDAYQNFSRVIEIDLVTFGNQLIGVLLFFIPRTFWADKPVGSGALLAEIENYDFSNISMPFIGEGYINFGIIGVNFFMFTLGLILANLDKLAFEIKKTGNHSLFIYYYYFLFGMIFFMMRGDLLSSFAYIIGLTISFLVISYCLSFLNVKLKLIN